MTWLGLPHIKQEGASCCPSCGQPYSDIEDRGLVCQRPLSADQLAQLNALDGNPETSDIPEAPAENWASARLRKPAPAGMGYDGNGLLYHLPVKPKRGRSRKSTNV